MLKEQKYLHMIFCSPETEDGLERIRSLLDDTHGSFKDLVRSCRGSRLQGDPEELFQGALWVWDEL